MDFAFPSNRLLVAALVVFIAPVVALTLLREQVPPISQITLDGIYVNKPCPEFEIKNGTILFDSRSIQGEVDQVKNRVVLETTQALRYELDEAGCEFFVDDRGAINVASRRNGIEIFSKDRKSSMYWRRQPNIASGSTPSSFDPTERD